MASVTKTFVASTILRLWEDKKLKLEDPIIKYISKEHCEILIKGGYAPEKITILHLLTHSSGMAEHTQTEKFKIEYEVKDNHVNFVCKTKDGRVDYQHLRPKFD